MSSQKSKNHASFHREPRQKRGFVFFSMFESVATMSVIANPLFINYSIAPNENKVSEKSILCVEDLIGPFIGDFHAPDRFLRAIFPILLISLHFAATLRFRIARERLPMPIYTRSLHSMKVVIQ